MMIKSVKRWCFMLLAVSVSFSSCKKYLDVVPDNMPTLDNAFSLRSQAMKYLYTCYSYMPRHGSLTDNPAIAGGDEVWQLPARGNYFYIAKGEQKVDTPFGDRWQQYYRALRDCNIFLENIDRVPDLEETERNRWISEVKFLKAYYHFILVQMYGPIPLVKNNKLIDASVDDVKVVRDPLDECAAYIDQLLEEAIPDLPEEISDPALELGRITKPIAAAYRAYILVVMASPLFNGNSDQRSLVNKDGTRLFPEYDAGKWVKAAQACKVAIDMAHRLPYKLYYYSTAVQQNNLSATTVTQLNIRNSVTEKWNSEIIWANTQSSSTSLQNTTTPFLNPLNLDIVITHGELSPPLKIVEQYYSVNGVPITEDKTWKYNERYSLRESEDKDRLYIRKGYKTAALNYDREPRFYAHLGFDGGVWYGQGKYDDSDFNSLYHIEAKAKQRNGIGKDGFGTITGYFVKKLVHYQNVIANTGNTYSVNTYAWPIMRLSDLYLLYAEAINESDGSRDEALIYLNRVRQRAGLPTVQDAWTNYSTNPTKYTNKEGLRQIIQQERLIEMAFEGQRFWDLKRWKRASEVINNPVVAWDLSQEKAENYYRPVEIFRQKFGMKDYFWPIAEYNITVNRNLVQNTGW